MKKTTFSIVVPCYNEEKRIQSVFQTSYKLHKLKSSAPITISEIIFVNDGSTDQTLKVLRSLIPEVSKFFNCKVHICSYKENRGKGYALFRGAKKAKSDYVLYVDADLSIPLSNIEHAYPLIKQQYDVIIGSKKMKGSVELVKRSNIRRTLGKGYSIMTNLILGLKVSDYSAGFKIFSKRVIDEVFPDTTIDRWSFDTEVIFLAQRKGFSIAEFPVKWSHIEGSTVSPLRDVIPTLIDTISIRKNWLFNQNIGPLRKRLFAVNGN